MFDFILVQPGDAEMVLRAQLREDNEELREWFGLDGAGLIKLVEDTMAVLQGKAAADAKIEASAVRDYLVQKIRWSSDKRIPSVEICGNLMHIVAMFAKVPLATQISQLCKVKFGRDSLFDEHSKLYIILQKCPAQHDFSFALQGIWCDMLRKNTSNPYSSGELRSKTGPIAVWVFLKKLFAYWKNKYRFIPSETCPEEQIKKAWSVMESPLEYLQQSDSVYLSSTSTWPQALCAIYDQARHFMQGSKIDDLKEYLATPDATPAGMMELAVFSDEMDVINKAFNTYMGLDQALAVVAEWMNQLSNAYSLKTYSLVFGRCVQSVLSCLWAVCAIRPPPQIEG